MVKKVSPGLIPNRFTERTLGQRIVSLHHLFLAQTFLRVEQASLCQPCLHLLDGRFFHPLGISGYRRSWRSFSGSGCSHRHCGRMHTTL